jgi:16S rRNA (uracil1498-N3)-methyltransferase
MEIQATNFFVDPAAIGGRQFYLNNSESYHLAKVMRAKTGDIFFAIDGKGNKYQAEIIEANPNKVQANILITTQNENEPRCKIALACGLCRPAKVDFIVEKGTELGVSKFYFYISEKTLADDIDMKTASKKLQRWQKLALSATKQSMRTVIPEIILSKKYTDMAALGSEYEIAFVADLSAATDPLMTVDKAKPSSVILLVGPEAGLSEKELHLAYESSFMPVSLGPRRLRAETAAIAFTTIIMTLLGEL